MNTVPVDSFTEKDDREMDGVSLLRIDDFIYCKMSTDYPISVRWENTLMNIKFKGQAIHDPRLTGM